MKNDYRRHPLFPPGSPTFTITDVHFFVLDDETCVDVMLARGNVTRCLRFYACQDVTFSPAWGTSFGPFPYLYDVSGDGLEGLRVLVADDDAGKELAHLYLWARDVEEISR